MDLSVIIVSWNVRELLRRCLESIPRSLRGSELEAETIVVDNASSDGTPEMIKAEFPEVLFMASEVNLGFTKANNLALERSQGRYILLLNPDTEVMGKALVTMVSYMDAHPGVGLLGPQLLYPEGKVQSSRRRFPTLATAFIESTVLQPWLQKSRIIRDYYVLDRSDAEVQPVDWVVGACLLFRRQALEETGPLDERFFMYSEELDLAYRLKEKGWEVIYLPAAQVIHHEGRSSEQVLVARHIQFQRSKVLFFKKHFGVWRGEILRLFLLFNYLSLVLVEGVKWLVGHKRDMRRQRIRSYLEILRSGLR